MFKEPDFNSYVEQLMALTLSESSAYLNNMIPPSEKIIDPSTIHIYAQDFSISIANKEHNLCILRIRLDLVWTLFGTAHPTELFKSMHRSSYGGVCKHVGLRYGPWHMRVEV
jgi:hypothetical protein